MKNFEYNWATAEMVIMYLRNSRAQEKRKARKATEVLGGTQDGPAANTGPAAAGDSAGGNLFNVSDSEDDSDDE